jgi:diaminohydroxyphosphoribosylaminopyrimidine deaminase/5-amino-6-(5-phosphoribosylamino)uracil reductase
MAPESQMDSQIETAFEETISKASLFAGLTSPNPCVGAAALDRKGKILTVQAHERAGELHAEAKVIRELEISGLLHEAHSLIVTLEPCNHAGRTPPCADAIIKAGFRKVYFGAKDPNFHVHGGGAEKLRSSGLEVVSPEELPQVTQEACRSLIRTFAHWVKTGRPWVTMKTAMNSHGSMIPPPGQKTFTSPRSLKLAHSLRKRADAILTGSGTLLADHPEFTVRHVPDHSYGNSPKARWLAILDRRGRIEPAAITQAKQNGFEVYIGKDLEETLQFLGSKGVLEVLVEAGPTLSQAIITEGFWNQHVLIKQGSPSTESGISSIEDTVEIRYRSEQKNKNV